MRRQPVINTSMKTFRQFLESEDEIYAKKFGDVPEFTPALADSNYRVGDIVFSAKDGLGSVPFNSDVYYFGYVVLMKPSVFLGAALPHEGQREESVKQITRLIDDGYAVGQPWLQVSLDDFKDRGDPPKVKGHEGRARMLTIQRRLGDAPVPVHIFLTGGMRARDLKDEMIAALKARLQAEGSKKVITSPYERMYVNGKLV